MKSSLQGAAYVLIGTNDVNLATTIHKNKKIVRDDTITLIAVIIIGALIIFVMNLFIFGIL
jgi:hypothetical protein